MGGGTTIKVSNSVVRKFKAPKFFGLSPYTFIETTAEMAEDGPTYTRVADSDKQYYRAMACSEEYVFVIADYPDNDMSLVQLKYTEDGDLKILNHIDVENAFYENMVKSPSGTIWCYGQNQNDTVDGGRYIHFSRIVATDTELKLESEVRAKTSELFNSSIASASLEAMQPLNDNTFVACLNLSSSSARYYTVITVTDSGVEFKPVQSKSDGGSYQTSCCILDPNTAVFVSASLGTSSSYVGLLVTSVRINSSGSFSVFDSFYIPGNTYFKLSTRRPTRVYRVSANMLVVQGWRDSTNNIYTVVLQSKPDLEMQEISNTNLTNYLYQVDGKFFIEVISPFVHDGTTATKITTKLYSLDQGVFALVQEKKTTYDEYVFGDMCIDAGMMGKRVITIVSHINNVGSVRCEVATPGCIDVLVRLADTAVEGITLSKCTNDSPGKVAIWVKNPYNEVLVAAIKENVINEIKQEVRKSVD